MDTDRFDHLTKTLAAAGTRRNLVRLLTSLPIAGALLVGLDEEGAADRREKRRSEETRRQRVRDEGKKKGKRRKRSTPALTCVPESASQTCAGKCGKVANNCGTAVDCGSCTGCCDGNTCRTGADREACGTGGNTCQACSGVCGTGNVCTSCSPENPHTCPARMCCASGTCVAQCPDCQDCNSAGHCVSDPGQSRSTCRLAAGAWGVCCNGTCCAGCCDANEQCTACIAFITSTTYTGDLGGLNGADAKCQARAGVGGLPGLYKAWLSNSTQSPATRFRCRAASCSTEGYRRVDGVTIANDWDDLTTCDGPNSGTNGACLDAALNVTELNQPNNGVVWTNTTTRGTVNDTTNHCQNWTNGTSGTGRVGSGQFPNFGWTETAIQQPCTAPFSLYCFQQN